MKKYNFSRKHWMVIFLCTFLFMLTNACTSDGENVILPKLAEANRWDYSLVLTLASVAGVASVIGNLLLGKVCEKKGPVFSITLTTCMSAVFVFMYGASTQIWIYVVGLFGAICSAQAISYFGASALVANWFPTKKGLAMGIISIGPPLATIMMASVLNALMSAVGLRKGVLVISVVLVVVGVFSALMLKDTPEQCGETPDNMTKEELASLQQEEEAETSLPLKTLLTTRSFWYIVIICGVLSMSATGLMAQFLVRYTSSGFAESKAVLMLSVCAIVGIFGSVLVGNVQNMVGTKRAYAVFATIFAVAFLINFTNIPFMMYVSIPLFGIDITLLQIFMTSYEVAVFGRTNFKSANAIIFPITSMVGQFAFVVISVCMKLFGEIRHAYLIFGVLLLITLVVNQLLPIDEEA